MPEPTVLDRTPFTTWGGYGGLTLRGASTWTETVLRLDDGVERERALGEPSRWLAIDGTAHDGVAGPAPAGVVILDHPDNPRFPTPWYTSDTRRHLRRGLGELRERRPPLGRADDHRAVTPRPAVPSPRARRPVVDRADRGRVPTMGVLIDDSRALADGLLGFTVEAVGALDVPTSRVGASPHLRRPPRQRRRACRPPVHAHAPRARRRAGGRRSSHRRARRRAARGGRRPEHPHVLLVPHRRGAAPGRGLRRQPPPRRRVPTSSGTEVAWAVDSRDWIELLTADVLPRNYAAVLSRCELARASSARRRSGDARRPRRPPHRAPHREPRRIPRRLQ